MRRKCNFHPGVSPKYWKEARVVPRENSSHNYGKFLGQEWAGIEGDGGLGSEQERKPSRMDTQMEWETIFRILEEILRRSQLFARQLSHRKTVPVKTLW